MQKIHLAYFYGCQIFVLFILDTMTCISPSNYTGLDDKDGKITFTELDLLIDLKILLLLYVYFFNMFFIENHLNAVFQNVLIKFITISIWTLLGCKYEFSFVSICIIVLTMFSISFLFYSLYLVEDEIYYRFNKKVGLDSEKITKLNFFEILKTLKYVAMIFEFSSLLVATSFYNKVGQKRFNIVKLAFYILDVYLRKTVDNCRTYLKITIFFYIGFLTYGLLLLYYCIKNNIKFSLVFIYHRIMSSMIILVSVLALL